MPQYPIQGSYQAFVQQDPSDYMIETYIAQFMNHDEARRTITELLKSKNVMVNAHPLTATELTELGLDGTARLQGQAINFGLVWVLCYYDGTEDTGEIINGHPVVFDTVTGKAVTGINPAWKTDEYKIVGIAWKSFSEIGYGRIPIQLIQLRNESHRARCIHFKLNEDLTNLMGQAEVTINHFYDGTDPVASGSSPSAFIVYNVPSTSGFVWSGQENAIGKTSYDPEEDKDWIDWLECNPTT